METTKPKSKKFIALCRKYGVDPDIVPEVPSFEAACKIMGDNPKALPIVKGVAARHRKRLVADYKLSIIAEALRGKKRVNYNDNSAYKYFPVFIVKADAKRPSGFGLSYDGCDSWLTYSSVGVRLCFMHRDIAIFFGKHFLSLHKDHHLYT